MINIHHIHDLSNNYIIKLLTNNLSNIDDENIVNNYHPDNKDIPGNLFYILNSGRYRFGKGRYWVLEQDGEYLGSAGWNEYELDTDIALVLTRAYVPKKFRGLYLLARNILPLMIDEARNYKKTWITVNDHNDLIYYWFARAAENKKPALFNDWPEIYKNFKPIGKQDIYYTEQYVMEYNKELL